MKTHNYAFTLVELLVVVVIIGILAGLTLAVINPAVQRQRASEAVMRGQLSKVCGMLAACMSGQPSYNNAACDSVAEIGLLNSVSPTVINLPPNDLPYRITTTGPANDPTGTVTIISDVLPNTLCRMQCAVQADFTGGHDGRIEVVPGSTCRT